VLPKEVTSDLEANIARAKGVGLTDEERDIVDRIEGVATTLSNMAVEKPTDVMRNKELVPLLRAAAVAQGKVAQAQNYVRAVEAAAKAPLTKAQRKKADASPEGRVEVIQKRRAKLAEKQAEAQSQLKAAQDAQDASLAALNKAVGEARQSTVTDIPADVNEWLGSVAEGRVTPEDTARVTQQLDRMQRLGEAGDIRQAELPLIRQGKPDTLAMVFKSIKDFNTFLASNALDRLRKEEFGWKVRPTLARIMRKLEGLPEKIATATSQLKRISRTREAFEDLKSALRKVERVATAERFDRESVDSTLAELKRLFEDGKMPSDLYNTARQIVEGRRDIAPIENKVDAAQARVDKVTADIRANIDGLDAKIAFEPERKTKVKNAKDALKKALAQYDTAKARLAKAEKAEEADSEELINLATDYDNGALRQNVTRAYEAYTKTLDAAVKAEFAQRATANIPKLSLADFEAALVEDARLFDELRSARGQLSQAKGMLNRGVAPIEALFAEAGITERLAETDTQLERVK